VQLAFLPNGLLLQVSFFSYRRNEARVTKLDEVAFARYNFYIGNIFDGTARVAKW
jgi:hypothetical protein